MPRYQAGRRKPKLNRIQVCLHPPAEPGWYFWSEWPGVHKVYKKPRSNGLFVTPPGGIEIRVSRYIAGQFVRVKESTDVSQVH